MIEAGYKLYFYHFETTAKEIKNKSKQNMPKDKKSKMKREKTKVFLIYKIGKKSKNSISFDLIKEWM